MQRNQFLDNICMALRFLLWMIQTVTPTPLPLNQETTPSSLHMVQLASEVYVLGLCCGGNVWFEFIWEFVFSLNE